MPLVSPFRTSFGTADGARRAAGARRSPTTAEGWGECVAMADPLYSSEYVDAAADVLRRFLVPGAGRGRAARRRTRSRRVLRAVQGPPDGQGRAGDGACSTPSCAPQGRSLRPRARRGARPGARAGSRSGSWTRIPAAARRRRRLPRRGLRPDQAQDRAGLGRRAGARGPRAVRRRRAAAGRRQHRVHAGRRPPPGPARPLRPAAHRAAARRGGRARPRRPGPADPHPDLPRRVDRLGAVARPTRSAWAPAAIVNIKPGRVGGYLEARRIHDVCVAHGVAGVVRRDARDRPRPGRQRRARRAARLHAARRHLGVRPLLPHATSPSRSCSTTATSPCRPGPGSGVAPLPDELAEVTTATEWLRSDVVEPTRARSGASTSTLTVRPTVGGAVTRRTRAPRQPRPGPRRPRAPPCSTSSHGDAERRRRHRRRGHPRPGRRAGAAAARAGARRRRRRPGRRSSRCSASSAGQRAAGLVRAGAGPADRRGRARRPTRRAWRCSA